jgi:hypothetical protein
MFQLTDDSAVAFLSDHRGEFVGDLKDWAETSPGEQQLGCVSALDPIASPHSRPNSRDA